MPTSTKRAHSSRGGLHKRNGTASHDLLVLFVQSLRRKIHREISSLHGLTGWRNPPGGRGRVGLMSSSTIDAARSYRALYRRCAGPPRDPPARLPGDQHERRRLQALGAGLRRPETCPACFDAPKERYRSRPRRGRALPRQGFLGARSSSRCANHRVERQRRHLRRRQDGAGDMARHLSRRRAEGVGAGRGGARAQGDARPGDSASRVDGRRPRHSPPGRRDPRAGGLPGGLLDARRRLDKLVGGNIPARARRSRSSGLAARRRPRRASSCRRAATGARRWRWRRRVAGVEVDGRGDQEQSGAPPEWPRRLCARRRRLVGAGGQGAQARGWRPRLAAAAAPEEEGLRRKGEVDTERSRRSGALRAEERQRKL